MRKYQWFYCAGVFAVVLAAAIFNIVSAYLMNNPL
jgi:hypothetical protein